MEESLKIAAPEGVDCFFDNVGGQDSTIVMNHMNTRGRIACCGAISTYNSTEPMLAANVQGALVSKVNKGQQIPLDWRVFHQINCFQELLMQGFRFPSYAHRSNEAVLALAKWIMEGKLVTRETMVEGFENVPLAFKGLFTVANIGKMVVKC